MIASHVHVVYIIFMELENDTRTHSHGVSTVIIPGAHACMQSVVIATFLNLGWQYLFLHNLL